MTDRGPSDARPDGVPRITGGSPTEEEAAAIAAVFAELMTERALARQRLRPALRPSGWMRTTRALRSAATMPPRWGED